MHPAIGDFHIFPALRLAVMPSPYITEITAEMQQKIKIFAEKVSRHKKAKSAQAFLLQKSIPAAPCKGLATGPQAARRTGGQANRRFASAAPPPGLRPAPPPHHSSAHARGGMCEGGTIAVPPSRSIRAAVFKSVKRYALPPAPKRTPPAQNAQACPHARGGMCEGRTIGGSSLRIPSGHRPRFCRGYALPSAPAKKTPFGVFFAGAADGN